MEKFLVSEKIVKMEETFGGRFLAGLLIERRRRWITSALVEISSELVRISFELVENSSELVSIKSELLIISIFKNPISLVKSTPVALWNERRGELLCFNLVKGIVKR